MKLARNIKTLKQAKGIKYVFIGCILLMAILVAALFGSTKELGVLGEDGYAVPDPSIILESLRDGRADVQGLAPVNFDDTVYSSISGYLVGEKHTKIDKDYPIYINGGAGLRFLNEENWLLSADISLLRSYEGMYLNDGTTYNSDMTQADAEEFILLALPNGLYMNTQPAVFTNLLGSTRIPANSIIQFNDDSVRWYAKENSSLIYYEIGTVFAAKISIGEHSYVYVDFLKALGLLREAIDRLDKGENADELLNEMEQVMDAAKPKGDKDKDKHGDDADDGAAQGGNAAAGGAQAGAGQAGGGTTGNIQTGGNTPGKDDSSDSGDNSKPGETGKPGDNEGDAGKPGDPAASPSPGANPWMPRASSSRPSWRASASACLALYRSWRGLRYRG